MIYHLGADDWQTGLLNLGGKIVDKVGDVLVSKEETAQTKLTASGTPSGGTIPTDAWDQAKMPLIIGGAALVGLVLIMTLTKR
jgi:hypothetical protein